MTLPATFPSARRPLLLRALPDRLAIALWSRAYRGKHARWSELYHTADLRYAPGVTMRLKPGDVISDCIAFTGIYERLLTRRVSALARAGGTMIEVGANIGYFSLLWASARKNNRCISFEASPRIIEMLRSNVSRNGFEDRIDVVPMAAGAASGRLAFDVGPAEQTGWGGFAAKAGASTIDVAVIRVDDYVASNRPIALLKIDAEGADSWALEGCERLLAGRMVEEVWYEQNKPRMRALEIPVEAAQTYLRRLGYDVVPRSDISSDVVEWSARPAMRN
ncbi:MAG: FkbM family methyltransferase [Gemmatimonadales bacterium]